MKKILMLIAIILLSNKLAFSQESFLTEKQNAEWISNFEKLTIKKEQIKEIKSKIISDSIYTQVQGVCKTGVKVNKNEETTKNVSEKSNCECKIVFVLGFKDDTYLLESIKSSKIDRTLKLITDENINEITILKGTMSSAIYGSRGRCGTVIMHSDNEKLERKLKSVL